MLDKSAMGRYLLNRAKASFLKMGVTFAVLRMLGNIDVLNKILPNNEIGLRSSFLNSFKKLFGMLTGPNAFFAFSELIIDITSSISVALNVKISSTGSER